MNPIDRRTFLRGAGTLVALPLLERMLPGVASASTGLAPAKAAPIRTAFLFVPNGVNLPLWKPAAAGALAGPLPETLRPLEAVREKLVVMSGLTQKHAFANGDGAGDHARSTASWLTGVQAKKTSGADIRLGVSADQIAAREIGDATRFPSLEIGCERGGVSGDCDSGYSCAYSSNVSWRNETTPVAKEINPRLVFERLFGSSTGKEAATRRDLLRRSVLDFVAEDAAILKGQLGRRDLTKLDEYFTGIREIERRLVKFESDGAAMVASGMARPSGIPGEYQEHIRLMGDMMILAFQTDMTRVCTFMFANDGSNRSYASIGVPEGHHDVSHHGHDKDKLAKKAIIDRFHVEQLAYILQKMDSIKEGNGTMLDHTLLVYGAGISDGDAHNHNDLPLLVAGSGGGRLKTGRYVAYPDGTPMNNLLVSILDSVGCRTERFGDATGRLEGLF